MKIVFRIAIGMLAAFYAVVGHTVLHPRVSEHYRAYYIERSDFMSPWQHRDLVALQAGRAYAAAEPNLAFDGWTLREDGRRWNAGRTARLVFRVDDPGGAAHALQLQLAPLGTQRTLWRLNGRQIASQVLDAPATLRLALGAGQLRRGENELQVSLPDARPGAPGNPRLWALRLDGLRLD